VRHGACLRADGLGAIARTAVRIVAVAAVLCALGAAAAPRHPRAPATKVPGQVRYVTSERAFLNKGSADGLTAGMELNVTRGRTNVGACRIENLAEHSAGCAGGGFRVGDTFKFEAPAPPPAPAPRAPVATQQELAARAAQLGRASLPLVEFVSTRGERLGGAGFSAEVALSHNVWVGLPDSTNRLFQSEQLDLVLRGLDLTHGLKLYVDASVVAWSQRPDGFRLPQSGTFLLYVRETEVTRRESGPFVASVGRMWPEKAPGVGVIDGMQLGWRSQSGAEIGVYGGEIPNPIDLSLSGNRWTAGIYGGWSTATAAGVGNFVNYFGQTARLSLITEPETGFRAEAETALQMRMLDAVDAVGDVRIGLGGTPDVPAPQSLIEMARVDLSTQAGNALRVSAGLRYVGNQPTDVLGLGEPNVYEHRGLHTDGTALFTFSPSISATLLGGVFEDYDSGLVRGEAGPQLNFPRLFGDSGGLSVGYLFEAGWWGQRDAYVQAQWSPVRSFRFFIRGSFMQDAPASGTGSYLSRAVGLSTQTEVRLNRLMAIRLALGGQQQLGQSFGGLPDALRVDSVTGLAGSLSVVGQL
jgi:hypothetical protein